MVSTVPQGRVAWLHTVSLDAVGAGLALREGAFTARTSKAHSGALSLRPRCWRAILSPPYRARPRPAFTPLYTPMRYTGDAEFPLHSGKRGTHSFGVYCANSA